MLSEISKQQLEKNLQKASKIYPTEIAKQTPSRLNPTLDTLFL